MATQSPFSFLDGIVGKFAEKFPPPAWLVDETQHRVVLFLNHVLMQESEAQDRLARIQGSVVTVQWRQVVMRLVATPAGLLDIASHDVPSDLTLTFSQESPFEIAQSALRGDKPEIRIEGDVKLAGEVNWLVDNIRWDVEEDLSRVIGDAPAHTLAGIARKASDALRKFVARGPRASSGNADSKADA